MIGMKSSAFIRQVINTDQNLFEADSEIAWKDAALYEKRTMRNDLIEDDDEDDSEDDISLGKLESLLI